jgi:hypothetical protein
MSAKDAQGVGLLAVDVQLHLRRFGQAFRARWPGSGFFGAASSWCAPPSARHG